MADIAFNLKINNVGPHSTLQSTQVVSSLKLGIYASNGSGKTFISKIIRCIDRPHNPTNKLITFQQNTASLNMEFDNKGESKRTLNINLQKDQPPQFENKTGYIFHVFNSEYVNENLEAFRYKPESNIEGYVLGEVYIDLSREKKQLEELNEKLESDKTALKAEIAEALLEFEGLSIKKSTTEYKEFTYENVLNDSLDYEEEKTYGDLKKENTLLNTLPDDLPSVSQLATEIREDFFNELNLLLGTSHSKGSFSEEFKKKVNSKKEFIEQGLSHMEEDCPFCEQSISDKAAELIDSYTRYLEDEEAKIISKIDLTKKKIDNFRQHLHNNHTNFLEVKIKYDELKSYLPSFKETDLISIPDAESIINLLNELIEKLEFKRSNIEWMEDSTIVDNIQKGVSNFLSEIVKNSISNNHQIIKINETKSNSNTEKLSIKKRLIKAKYIEIQNANGRLISGIHEKSEEIFKLDTDIKHKEQKERAEKKELVAQTFQEYLDLFFGGKYTFDKVNFCLRFNTQNLIDNASDVLSDGEKGIVAFCHYLAETHRKVETQSDYQKLFFIIDDPISSLDFHFVYSIAQIIRKLATKFEITRVRYLILTHSIEFMSILIRNNVIGESFCLRSQDIKKIGKELLMPYEQHLKDIYDISIEAKLPTHTTPNSIRHIIETLNRFEKPDIDLVDYFDGIEHFRNNEFIYSLIHDNSHGGMRHEKAYVDDMLISGCKSLVSFISDKFSGQITIIQKH